MSRAFVKEDVDMPERITRRRSASGLPPGAVNYMSADGAQRMTDELARLRKRPGENGDEIVHLEGVLASATVVERPAPADTVTFGATVTVEAADGTVQIYRIVGADETEVGSVSWVSPLGRALLGANLGQRVVLPGEDKAVRTIVKIE